MSFKKRAAVAVAGALAGAVMMSGLAADAFAMYRVSDKDCASRTDFWKTWSTTGNTCWATNGTVDVNLLLVSQVSGGNNSGYFWYYLATGTTTRQQVTSYQNWIFYKVGTTIRTAVNIPRMQITGR